MKSFIPCFEGSITVATVAKYSVTSSPFFILLRCSDNFFDGKDLGENEKQVRMCNACYKKCWKYLVKHDESYI